MLALIWKLVHALIMAFSGKKVRQVEAKKLKAPEIVKPVFVTKQDYLKNRHKEVPLSIQQTKNMEKILDLANKLLAYYPGKFYGTSSGYRTPVGNKKAGGSAKSAHLTCEAIDLIDPQQELATFLLANKPLMEALGLYMEHPDYTPTWVHLQTRAASRRVFIPYSSPPPQSKFPKV